MEKSLLVTLANESYLEQAKQLFSSVYWNAGWKGDYMLMAHEVPSKKLDWFLRKGIIVKNVKPLANKKVGAHHHPIVLDKFYLFTDYFKQWDNIVFLDADIIVRASLDRLANVKGFAATNAHGLVLEQEFTRVDKKLSDELRGKHPLKGKSFNTGILAFHTSIIKKDTFNRLMHLYKRYGKLNVCGEEPTMNLLFYKRWLHLPIIYNTYPTIFKDQYKIRLDKINTIILHFVLCRKPWENESEFHEEWLANRNKAEHIDLSVVRRPIKTWTNTEVMMYMCYLHIRRTFSLVDEKIGLLGIFLKRYAPSMYAVLKRISSLCRGI